MPVRGSGAPVHPLQLLLLKLLISGHLPLLWPCLFGALPVPLLFTYLCCLLEAKSSTSASCWQTAGVLFSLPPSIICFIQFIPFPAVSGSPPPHPGASRTQQFRAHPYRRSLKCSPGGFPSGFRDSQNLSSPALGLCSNLIWCSHDHAAALSGPALSVRLGGCQAGVPRMGTGAPAFGLAALQKLGSE